MSFFLNILYRLVSKHDFWNTYREGLSHLNISLNFRDMATFVARQPLIKTTFDGRQPMKRHHYGRQWTLMESIFDEIQTFWKTPLIEDNLSWKTIFDWKQPLMEDILWWKKTFDGSCYLMEYNLRGRILLIDNDLWWKTTFFEIWSFMEEDLW